MLSLRFTAWGWSAGKGRGQRLEQAAKVCDPRTCCRPPQALLYQSVAAATGVGVGSKSGGGCSRGAPRGPQLRPSEATYAMVPVAFIAGDLLEAVPRDGAPSPRPQGVHVCSPLSPHLHHHEESIFPLKVAGHLSQLSFPAPSSRSLQVPTGHPGCYDHVPGAMASRRSHALSCSLGNKPVTFPHW